MSHCRVFKGRDGSWYVAAEWPTFSGSRIELACLGSIGEIPGVEAPPAPGDEPAGVTGVEAA